MIRLHLSPSAGVLASGVLAVALLGACAPAPDGQGTSGGSASSASAGSTVPGSSELPGLDGDAQPGAPAFVGASRAGLHVSALPGRGRAATGSDPVDDPLADAGIDSLAENRHTGTSGWLIGAQPPGVRIEGYADVLSALPGEPVGLHVSSTAPTFRVEVLRTGNYEGRWARRVWSSGSVAGGVRSGLTQTADTRMTSANWPRSVTLATAGWPPGAYLAKLIGADGAMSFAPFVIRNRQSTGAVLLVHSMATWQAYNEWGGPSTYRGYEESDKAKDFLLRSRASSFDRPYARGFGTGTFLTNELPAVAAAERLGLHLNYAADLDLQLHPEVLEGAVAVVLLGHSEYWSRQMRANLTAARDRGVNLAFLGANDVHRRIRLQPSPLGAGRVMVNYKLGQDDPVKTEDTTADWGAKPFPQPQSSLVGSMFRCAHADGDLVISDPRAWPFAGLGLAAGTKLINVVGPEFDRVNTAVSTPRPLQVLAHSPLPCRGQPDASDMVWYSHSSGAGVFAAGTLRWIESMTSSDSTTRSVVTAVTERVLREMAQPRAGARIPAEDNIADYYAANGTLRAATPGAP
ncbi:MAG: N,N-dimethylformamidase beta subunit family domain-containing protein, partial [Kineosporiaceae bacterium]